MTNEKPLHINDVFWTFQGEGLHAGRRALFVRMPYCNLACSWCDTSFNAYTKWSEEEFLKYATSEGAKFAVLTGGEPMLNKHSPRVIALLKSVGFEIACESNGTAPILDGIDFATVSPKRFSLGTRAPTSFMKGQELNSYALHPNAMERAHEFKYVVDAEFDFRILERHDLEDGRRYSLSPEFGNLKESLARIFEFISKNPGWRISLQTHKWMDVK